MQVDGTVNTVPHTEKSLDESSVAAESVMRSDITTQFPDTSSAVPNVHATEPILSSNIVTQLSDISDSIITSLSNSELSVTGNIASHGSIIITNDAIVFPPGTLMLTDENEPDGLDAQQTNQLQEDMDDDSGNENGEFDIKVEAVENNTLKSNLSTYKVQHTQPNNTNSTFTMNQNVLQNIQDPVGDMQQITFNGDHITQFHIQMPLSMTDIQNLQKINHNVFMSQAALPEDTKGLDGENIMIDRNAENIMVDDNMVDRDGESIIVDRNAHAQNIIVDENGKHEFLASNPSVNSGEGKLAGSVVVEDDNTVIVPDDNKEYLPPDNSFNADQHGNLFIKNENSNNPGNVIQGEEIVEGRVKCETSIASSSDNQLVTNLPYQQIMYVQVDSNEPGGDHQVFPITVSEGVNQNLQLALKGATSADNEQKTDVVKKRRGGRTRAKKVPYQVDKSNLRTLAPRLLSFPLYAGAQAAVGIGKSLLKPVNLGALQIIEGGQYFEVLGRCTQCFRFSRTTTYCRAEKNHRDPKSSVCMECEAVGLSTVVCRRKLNHSAPNAQPLNIVINTALQNTEHVKQLCIRNNLPPCFCELHSIVVHHADITFVGQRRDNTKSEMKAEMKYDIQEFGNTDLLSSSGLTRSDDGDYGNGDMATGEVHRTDNGEFGSNMLSSAELGGKNSVDLTHDGNMLSAPEITRKDDAEYDGTGLTNPHVSRKPYIMKSEMKYDDVNEFDYNDFITIPRERVSRRPTDYARGYLYPYTKERWAQWLLKFCYQTSTNFRIRTGKRVNKKLDHGLANHNGRIVPYRTLETQLYNCALGGRPRKRKAKDGIKKRKERGSKLIGCQAVIHTRLLETEYDWCALEVTAPKILAHLPFHDPRQNNADVLVEYEDILLSQNNPNQLPNNEETNDEQKFDFIHEVGDENENLNRKKDSSTLDVKKNTKSILLTCASLTEMIDNSSFMLSIQEQSRDLLNKMHKEAMSSKQTVTKKGKRKKFLDEQEQEGPGDENVVIDKEQIVSAENLQQIEHIGMVNMMN